MGILTAFFIYILIWWLVLFAVLPLGVERNSEDGKGHDAGAPTKPDLKKKAILTTVISSGILAVIWILVETGVIQWSLWFREAIK